MMSIEECRKYLEDDGKDLSDEEVKKIRNALYELGDLAFDVWIEEKRNMKTILVDAVNTFVIKNEGIFKEMQELLDSFKNRKIILTNADDEQMKKFGLDAMPYRVFTLKHNPDKTDPRYYEEMLKHFALTKDQVVYFEHNEEAVKSAESVGIKTYRWNPDKKDIEALKEFLKKNL